MNSIKIALCLILFAIPCFAADIHIEWGYTPPTNPPVSGFQLYKEGVKSCSTDNPNASSMDCTTEINDETTNFTLSALFTDGSESPQSMSYEFKINEVSDKPENPEEILLIYKIQVKEI